MLEIKNIIYNYDNWNLNIENIIFNNGEISSLVGKSGLGKSTLLNLIAGFNKNKSGEILLDNKDISHIKPNKRDVNILFQSNNLFHQLNLWENIAIGISKNLRPTNQQKQKIHDIIERLQLTGKEKSYPSELSGGQQQRVAIARILLRDKKILLLDEPFNGLDKTLKLEILEIIKTITKENNIITILVSHQQEDLSLSSRTYEIKKIDDNHSTIKLS